MAGMRYYNHSKDISPKGMAATVQEDVRMKQELFRLLIEEKELTDRIFTETLTDDDIEKLSKQPYYIYAYKNNALCYWNTNKILADCIGKNGNEKERLLFNEKGVFIIKCHKIAGTGRHITALFPVMYQYPFENKYLANEFAAGSYIPANTRIHNTAVKGGYAIKSTTDGQVLFYLKFNTNSLPQWIPDWLMMLLLAGALIASIAWLQLISINISRKRSNILGFAITVIVITGCRLLTYQFGMPFNLSNLPIFSPQIYATSDIHRSLGDLLLNALCVLWIVAYVVGNVSVGDISFGRVNKYWRYVLATIFSLLIIAAAFTFINLINSLVVDSAISFDASNFYSINKFTIYGLITVGVISISCCLLIYFLNLLLKKLLANQWLKYLLIGITGLLVIVVSDVSRTGNLSYGLLAWLLLFIILLDVKKLTYSNDVLAPHMIFWAFFVCVFCTSVLQYFNTIKEKDARLRFADAVAQQRDYPLEDFMFRTIAETIQNDHALQSYMQAPDNEGRKQLNERFEMLYFGSQLNKYQAKILLYDAAGNSLYNNDTLSYNSLRRQMRRAELTSDSNLYYKEYAQDGHYYLGTIPLRFKDSSMAGYLFIDLAVKESTGETVYPELLQPRTLKTNLDNAGYSYAIYTNNRLQTQTNDYTFPVFFNEKIKKDYRFVIHNEKSELWYQADKNKIVVVVQNQKLWLESITLFSYLFGIQVLVAILIVLYKSVISYLAKPKLNGKLINFTLRRRIHFSMLSIVLVSFLIIGLVTIVYFTFQYKQNTREKLLGVMQVVERSVNQYLEQENALTNPYSFNRATNTAAFKYFITNLANAQKTDINIFNASGILNVTSQDNIYDRALLARIMRQDAYHALWVNKKSLLMQDENIGKLSHLSCYVPVRDEAGIVMGYINIPYFASQKELNYQISNILVALINLYAFVFLLSGILTVFITRWITRSFNIVISQFEKLNLSKNELIEWPYEDEIGLLVDEYNKMVKKVEANAMMMARNERESAWREMAKQVAHEIKNPLTPMKLNIQYLQQALRNNYDNVRELTVKVSESLIEQIDNLSYIASEFSNFAKMPEAVPENIEVNELTERVAELYLNESEVKVEITKSATPIYINADRSQLLRVFTNLLQNAVQSIPQGRDGLVNISIMPEGSDVVIAFADNGTGISSDIVDKIFQPYFTTKTSGTGLGLAMTRKIIEFWKGKIWFDTTPDKGTTFYVRMPMTDEA
ncbi:hypothetical protein CAP35_03995 [Chitinophagaceae bacterium IBVUCB1]|nr:hypothetical protein CAP35_03995 [Chitinophagaceae bacterium IBVUCB1]